MKELNRVYKNLRLINTDEKYLYYKGNIIENNEERIIRVLKKESCTQLFIRNLAKVREAVISLDHENLIKIYDIRRIYDIYYIEQEYFDGLFLSSIFTHNINISDEKCLEIIIDLCEGLKVFHKKGQIFRRIHPSNILIDNNLKAKLDPLGYIDLEINTKFQSYLSPEQSINGYIKTQSDIYNLGILLYEMIYREEAINLNNEKNLYDNIIQGTDLSVKDVNADIKYLINRMTKIKPVNRYKTLEDVISDINTYLEYGEINNKVIEVESKRVTNKNYDYNMNYENVENIDFTLIPKVDRRRKYRKIISLIVVSLAICILGARLLNFAKYIKW